MGIELAEEFRRVRRVLIPCADSLGEATGRLPRSPDFEEQTRLDLEAIRRSAERFRAEIEVLFPDHGGAGSAARGLRESRHDARNLLNSVFGLAQVLQISRDYPRMESALQEVLDFAEKCRVGLEGREDAHLAEEAVVEGAIQTGTEGRPRPGRILIVDDREENRVLLARLLEPMGLEIDHAVNGCEAIRKIMETGYDAVLLDIQMPEMDGFEVLDRLSKAGRLRITPVIVVTGLQGEMDAVRCIEIGAEDFLSRPIRQPLLLARLNASLEKKRLREQVFERHFTPRLAEELARHPDPLELEARKETVSLLFCDIRGFSSISERLDDPNETVKWLRAVLEEFSGIVIRREGVLVDYTGDELMAMWGAPGRQTDHAERACDAALEMLGALNELNAVWRGVIGEETRVGIGINTGEAMVGNIGTQRKFKYGPLGTVVNLASRVQGATRYLDTPLLVTGATVDHLGERFLTRRLFQARVQNIQQPVQLHQLFDSCEGDWCLTLASKYEHALEEFERNRLPRAAALVSEVLEQFPEDGPSVQLNLRIAEELVKGRRQVAFSPILELPGK